MSGEKAWRSGGATGPFSRPLLCRQFATSVGCTGVAATSAELRQQVMAAFDGLPFHGNPIELPCGSQVVRDSWSCALEHELDEFEKENRLEDFDLEAWLSRQVQSHGTPEQQREFAAFVQSLDDYEQSRVDQVPNFVEAVPLREVEVYRDLSNIDLSADVTRGDVPGTEDGPDNDEEQL